MSDMSQSSKLDAAHLAAFTESIKETLEASSTAAMENLENQQDATKDTLQQELTENTTMAGIIKRDLKRTDKAQEKKVDKTKHVEESILVRKEDADDLADQFSRRQGNREYHLDPKLLSQLLLEELGAGINENSDIETIIGLIRRRMTVNGEIPDPAIIDRAFEFLVEANRIQLNKLSGDNRQRLANIVSRLEIAKDKHFKDQTHTITDNHGKVKTVNDITTAHHIIGAVDAVAQQTGRSVKETLDSYREMVHNLPEVAALQKSYEAKGGYRRMALEFKGLSAYLGSELKRTNLDNPELAQLTKAARTMQAALFVYKIAMGHLPTMESYLQLNGILDDASAPAA